jgi:hypothetical protein
MSTNHIAVLAGAVSRSLIVIAATFPDSRPKLYVYCNGVDYLYTQTPLEESENLPTWVTDEVTITESGSISDLYRETPSQLLYIDLDGNEHNIHSHHYANIEGDDGEVLASECIRQYVDGITSPEILTELHKTLVTYTIRAMEELCGLAAPKNKPIH